MDRRGPVERSWARIIGKSARRTISGCVAGYMHAPHATAARGRGEAMAARATTTGIMTTINIEYCTV